MQIICSLLFFIGQTVSAILICPIALLSIATPSMTRARVIATWARFNIWTLRVLCGVTYSVEGLENIPDKPSIILSKHQSAWETLAFQIIFPPQSYVLKKQLLWIPFFGWGLAANRPIAINRSKKTRALDMLIKEGKIRLDEGRWLVIFPEGTRMLPGETRKFQVGGAMIAEKTKAMIVPVAHNAGMFWPKNGFLKHPGKIQVVIGKPIESNGSKARQLNEEAEIWIKETMKTLPGS